MATSVYFNGENITIPGAYSAIDTSGMTVKSNTGASIIAILGESRGGEPGAVNFLSDPVTAKKVLKGGYLLKACQKAWNPVSATKIGVSLGGANTIAAIRTNVATKSKLEIKDTSEKTVVTLQSKDWGANTNYQVRVTDGTLKGTKTVTVYDQENGKYENYANIGNAFTISYTGDQAYAELNIYLDGQKAMYFQTKVGASKDAATEDINIALNDKVLKNLNNLIEQLRSYENYTISTANASNLRLKPSDLDLVSAQSIKLDSGSTPYRVTAVLADLKYRLDSQSQLIEVDELSEDKSVVLPNIGYTYLTGGSEGSSPSSWIEYFDSLSNYDIDYIVPLTSDMSIQAELLAHITQMSGNLGKERRGVIGGEVGESISDAMLRASNISSDRIQMVYGGEYDTNESGETELYPPYILAAQHAGRAAFLTGGESATHDTYRMIAAEYQLGRSEISSLLNAGIMPFETVITSTAVSPSASSVRLVQDLTTDTVDTDVLHVERATGALADSINREIRNTLDTMLTGRRATRTDITSAANAIVSILKNRQNIGDILEYKDVSVVKDGTVTTVNYSVAPTEPNNYTLITAHYYTSTISVSDATSANGE